MSSQKVPATQVGGQKAYLAIKVQPRSAKTCISDVMDDGTIRVKLNAPPVEGKANEALIQFLADILDVKETFIEIKSGQTSRKKLLKIEGMSQEQALNIINANLKK
jgi:uncharacterized protein